MSPISHVAATTGDDGTVRLYDYFEKKSLCQKKFNTTGHCVLWIPKVIDSTCSSILVGFADGVVRHLSITNSNKRTSKTPNAAKVALHLTQVFKPHLKAVTCMVMDTEGKVLATSSEDGTVFFFQVGKTFKPLGFVDVETHVVSMEFSSVAKGSKLLVVGKNGATFEFKTPDLKRLDTSKSFKMETEEILLNRFQFKSVKDDLIRKEEEAQKAKDEMERQRKRQAEFDRKRALGITEDENDANDNENESEKKKKMNGEGDDDEDEEIEEVEDNVVHEQGNVMRGFYRGASSDKFVITMDGWDAGFLYECEFPKAREVVDENEAKLMAKFGQKPVVENEDDDESVVAIKIPDINDVPITALNFSKTNDFIAMGLQNGAVRIQNMKRTTLDKLDSYWWINAHDNHAGSVQDIAISFDSKFLISVGEDGNIFTFSFMDEEKLKEFDKTRTKMTAKTIESRPADDIDDPKHYSIELEKQKAEQDKKLRLAEEKKQNVKAVIAKLRREFRKLRGKNAELPSYLQLPASEFIIDPKMKLDIEDETKNKVDLLHRETAWESEKHDIALRKLQLRFKEHIECDRIVLHSFLTEHCVASFRASELSKEFYKEEEENNKKITFKGAGAFFSVMSNAFRKKGQTHRKGSKDKGGRRTSSDNHEENVENDEFNGNIQKSQPQQPQQKLEGKVAKMIEKAEQRRMKRISRQKEWEELYRNQPDENYEDPEDSEAIDRAEKTIGDFKLKTASDYVVPENERVNAEKKRAELFNLQREIHDMKKGFNDKLFMLRNRKVESIAEIKALVDKLETVQSDLPERCHVVLPIVPEMKPDEQPEKKTEYTREILVDFRKNVLGLDITKVDDNIPAIETHTSKATTRATTNNNANTNDPRLRSTSIISTFSSIPPSATSDSPEPVIGGPFGDDADNDEDEKSPLQLMIEKEQEIRLTYERDELLREIREKLFLFDAVLRLLRHEKIHLDVTLKNAELRKVTLYEEYMLLKDFEKREDLLANKVLVKMQEKDDIEDKVDELKELLSTKKDELEKLQERENTLNTTLNNTIGDGNKFEAFLIKVYKKKIKRVKKKTSNEGSSEDGSGDDDSDDDYDESDGSDVDSDEEELDDSVCPSGCDPATFDQICSLRERRLDMEELLFETKKTCDTVKKDLDTVVKKVKVVDGALKNARGDLEAFQREKQQKLNELDVVVTLKLDQIQYVLNNALPQDLSQCLVIRKTFLDRLQRRIKELEREKITQKQLYKERRQQHVQMLRDKKTMSKKIKELEDRVQQIQMLKFGRLVDLEKLETVSVNRVAEELKEKLREQEGRNIKDLHNYDKMISKLQMDLTQHVRENTKRLDTYTVLHQTNRGLEVDLDSRQKNLGSEFQGDRKSDEIERERLAQLVQMQSNEIQQLEDEINILSRKGGHVLPPQRNGQLTKNGGAPFHGH